MGLKNTTKRQHYLPQVEQRMNAANPTAAPHRQIIYAFKVLNHEHLILQLERPGGVRISNNLAIFDLFSFDVAQDKTWRMNFESQFGRLESMTETVTGRLLDQLAVVVPGCEGTLQGGELYDDLVALFKIKLMNFARSPHSIPKVLNTLGVLANFDPTAPHHLADVDRILHGRRPQQERLCAELGISGQDYVAWLKLLFMLFVECDPQGATFLDGVVKGIFESNQLEVAAMVCTYTDPVCLLSDRGFSTNIRQPGVDGFDFNLTSRAFVRYIFGGISALVPQASARQLNGYRRAPRSLRFFHQNDALDLLGSFNRNVIHQSAERVFSAIKDPVIPSLPTEPA